MLVRIAKNGNYRIVRSADATIFLLQVKLEGAWTTISESRILAFLQAQLDLIEYEVLMCIP